MSGIERLYYNLDRLVENHSEAEETKEARETMESMLESLMDREDYLECEAVIAACMSANEKQGFIEGFQYAASLLTCGLDSEAVRRAAECQ